MSASLPRHVALCSGSSPALGWWCYLVLVWYQCNHNVWTFATSLEGDVPGCYLYFPSSHYVAWSGYLSSQSSWKPFQHTIIRLHEVWPSALSSSYHSPISESMQKEKWLMGRLWMTRGDLQSMENISDISADSLQIRFSLEWKFDAGIWARRHVAAWSWASHRLLFLSALKWESELFDLHHYPLKYCCFQHPDIYPGKSCTTVRVADCAVRKKRRWQWAGTRGCCWAWCTQATSPAGAGQGFLSPVCSSNLWLFMSSVNLLADIQHSFRPVHSSKEPKFYCLWREVSNQKLFSGPKLFPLRSSPRVSKSCQPFALSEVLRDINALFSLYLQFIGNTGLSPEA